MKTNAEYKALERQRREAKGYIRQEYWIKPTWKDRIKKYIRKLK